MTILIAPVIDILGQAVVAVLQANKQHLDSSDNTSLEIRNDTNGEIKIKGSEVDNHAWDGD